MNHLNTSLENCKRYMHHEMPENENEAFEIRMRQDGDFKNEVEQNLQAMQALARGEIRARAAKGFAEMEAEHRQKKQMYYRYTGIAASVLILVSLGLFFMFPGKPDMQEMFEENYHFQKVGARSINQEQDSLWIAALEHYEMEEEKGFSKAISMFQALLSDSAFDHRNDAHLYLGHSFLGIGQPDSAIASFQQVEDGAVGFYGDAVWNTALSYLQKEDLEGACKAFTAFSRNSRWPKALREKAKQNIVQLACE